MPKKQFSFLKLLPLFLVILLDVMGVVLIIPVLTPLILQVNSNSILPLTTPLLLRDFLYGFILALYPLFMFFSTPILGDLSDKLGRKKTLLICLGGSSVSYFVSAIGVVVHNLFIVAIGRIISGLTAGTQPIASAAIIDVSDENTKTSNLSWVVLVSSVGIIIGPLLGGLTSEKNLMRWFTFETPFILAGCLSILNAMYLFFSFKDSVKPNTQIAIKLSTGFILFLNAFRDNKFRILSLAFVTFTLAWSLYFQGISWFFMEYYNYSSGKIGLFIGYIGLIFMMATLFLSKLANKFFKDESQTFLFFVVLMGIADIAGVILHHEYAQWIWVIFNATSNVICYTVSLTLFSNLADNESQGWIMGVVGSLGAITWTVGGIIAGPLGYIDVKIPLIVAGCLCVVSFLVMKIYKKTIQGSNIV